MNSSKAKPHKKTKAPAPSGDVTSPELPFGETAPAGSPEIEPGPLDERFAEFLERLNGRPDPAFADAARLASAWRSAGHICFPLEKLAPRHGDLTARLLATPSVGRPGEWKPLILDPAGRLYLYRYWQYEQSLAAAIRSRLQAAPPPIDRQLLETGLTAYFGPAANDQRTAAETALTGNFCVITGGPGTGKTRTVARVLALLHAQFAASGAVPRIALAAPTGKAAARMTESIRQAVSEFLGAEKPAGLLENEAVTLHRLLGIAPDSSLPRFDARQPLPVHAVIVDEASMVDLALMAKLFAATPSGAPIILLGDKDQLASVEAGHVLGDICQYGASDTPAPLRRCIVELRQSFRFKPGSGIHELSLRVNAGEADGALELLRQGTDDVSALILPAPEALAHHLRKRVATGFRPALTSADPCEALTAFNQFRILCAVRQGPFGVEALNRLAEQALAEERLIAPGGLHYHGRPVMILRNDYNLRLFNGDIGLILRDPEAGGALRAFFFAQDGGLRRLVPARLPEHETVWAMTVHKSQGSEFGRVLLIVPDRENPVLTRELVYTGITRPREAVELWYREASLRQAIARRTERVSGLHDALWSKP